MSGVNKVILIGTLGQDPETKFTQAGKTITNLSIATSEKWKDQQGQDKEATEWHRVVLFGKQAEAAGKYLTKGKKVYIEGKLKTDKWQDKQGNDRYTTQIVAMGMEFLSPQQQQTQGQQQAPQQQAPAPPAQPQQQPGQGFDDMTDSIPF